MITLIAGFQIPPFKEYKKYIEINESKEYTTFGQGLFNFYNKIPFEELTKTIFFKDKDNKNIEYRYPETFLHPSYQCLLIKDIVNWCLNNNSDLFICTHSDHIWYSLRILIKDKLLKVNELKVIFIEDNVYEIKVDERGRIDNSPKGFFDQFRINQGKLL